MNENKKSPVVVVVGAGFGGLELVKHLKKAPVQVIVVDRSNHHLFQPLLYQVATAGLSASDIASPIRGILRDQENADVRMENVLGVDTKASEVVTDKSRIHYDFLILATGAQYNYFGHSDWEKVAPGLKSVADALLIRRKILVAFEEAELELDPIKRQALLNFVIVGGGPTGVELAGAIAELAHRALAEDFRHVDTSQAKVTLIEAGPRVLSSFSESISAKALRALERLKVTVRTQTRVERIDKNGVYFKGETVLSKNVVWAAGVVASPAGKWLGADVDSSGRVRVAPDLRVPGHNNIFVIGDTASLLQDGKPLPGVSPVAMQQGRFVARMIQQLLHKKSPTAQFRYFDKGSLATVGRGFAVAEFKKFSFAGFFAWLTWIFVHIFYLIGFRNRILVMIEWAWAYVTFQRGARLIVSADNETLPES